MCQASLCPFGDGNLFFVCVCVFWMEDFVILLYVGKGLRMQVARTMFCRINCIAVLMAYYRYFAALTNAVLMSCFLSFKRSDNMPLELHW